MKKNNLRLSLFIPMLLALLLFSGCALPLSGNQDAPPGTEAGSAGPKTGSAGPEAGSAGDKTAQASFDSFLNSLFCSEVASNSINLHFTLMDPTAYGITDAPVTLGDISEKAVLESHAELENTLACLNGFDYSALDTKRQLTYDILNDYLSTELRAADFTLYDEILRPSTGIQSQLPVLYEEYKFYSKEDIEDYLTLIGLTEDYFSQIISLEKKKADAGLFMSDFACKNIISQCQTFTADPDGHYLIETFNHKADQLEGLTDAEREDYKARNEALIRDHVLPAYEELAKALTGLMGRGKNDKGLCCLDRGKEFYEYLVYYDTGCSSKVPEIQQMIEDARKADLAAAAALAAEQPDIFTDLQAASIESTDSVTTLNTLKEQMKKQFPDAPDTEFTVSYIDECMEDFMAPAFYITAPIDNYDNNSIFINASTDTTTMRYFTTLAHEGFPGHLYQTVMSYDAGLSPVRATLNYPGYVEGWATYVEMISYQYAGLDETTAEMMMRNQSALLSLYASSDIGIHYDGWSFKDMLKFWSDYGISDAQTLREVYELIVEEPAHYLKYYVGYLEFLNLKEYARETYGSGYSDIAFHKAVLEIGPAPFDIVKKYLDAYYKPED